ncbi:alpha/beta fold hydrolase [Haladaptatus sp. GCM10025707]|uniref:alpha/beta fold hydrolase n=2 Tax=unclassified Haladaptatus TaxID=2622732 RepID=UPI00361D27A5
MRLPYEWAEATIPVNGVDLQCYRTGNGPPLLMAHGFYENAPCMAQLANDLADDYEVILYDARGHGMSDASEAGYTIDDRVADLVGVVDHLDLEDPILFGHSMGGSAAAWTTATHPDLPRALVLEDPANLRGHHEIEAEKRVALVRDRLEAIDSQTVAELASDYEQYGPNAARQIAIANTECHPHIVEIAREGYPRTADAFPKIECPTLVLKSDADTEVRAADVAAAEPLRHGRLVHIYDAGHSVFRDQYDAAFAELQTFLHRVETRTSQSETPNRRRRFARLCRENPKSSSFGWVTAPVGTSG